MKREMFVVGFSTRSLSAICSSVLIFALGNVAGLAQLQPKKQAPAAPQGYLTKSKPPSLRFSAPPKPPVAYLEASAITAEMPPVFADKFLDKGDTGVVPPDRSDLADSLARGMNGDGSERKAGNKKPSQENSPPRQSEGQLLHLLVKYFDKSDAGATSTNNSSQFIPPFTKEITVPIEPEPTKESKVN